MKKFSDLVLEPAAIDEEMAVKLVAPFFRYTPDGELIFIEGFRKLSDRDKVIWYLVGRFGLFFIRGERDGVGATSKEIADKLRVVYSSVRVYITDFRRKGWVTTDPGSKKHEITNQALADLGSTKAAKNEKK